MNYLQRYTVVRLIFENVINQILTPPCSEPSSSFPLHFGQNKIQSPYPVTIVSLSPSLSVWPCLLRSPPSSCHPSNRPHLLLPQRLNYVGCPFPGTHPASCSLISLESLLECHPLRESFSIALLYHHSLSLNLVQFFFTEFIIT